jgi:hypothetical protein
MPKIGSHICIDDSHRRYSTTNRHVSCQNNLKEPHRNTRVQLHLDKLYMYDWTAHAICEISPQSMDVESAFDTIQCWLLHERESSLVT